METGNMFFRYLVAVVALLSQPPAYQPFSRSPRALVGFDLNQTFTLRVSSIYFSIGLCYSILKVSLDKSNGQNFFFSETLFRSPSGKILLTKTARAIKICSAEISEYLLILTKRVPSSSPLEWRLQED